SGTARSRAICSEAECSGAGGAKGVDRGECRPAKHAPDAESGKRVTGAGTHTESGEGKEEGEVHRALPPHQHRPARRGVLRTQGGRCTWRGSADVEGLRGRPRTQARGLARPGPAGSVSGVAEPASVHTQAGRTTAPARCRSRRKAHPTHHGGRLPRHLVWIPARTAVLKNLAYHFKRIGLEAGPLSQWLFSALADAGLPVICVETRHMQAVLKAQINKTDRNDARGIAQMMRAGLYRPVHVKTIRSQKLRMLLTHRKLLQSKAIAIENDLRGTLRNFGLKVGMVGKVKFEARIRELVENLLPELAVLVEPMLIVRRTLREQIVILHRRLLAIVRDDEVCRRLMTTPGVGPVVALTYRATVDVPARFRKSKAVGAVFGLTCAKYQSGEVDRNGRVSR